MMDLEQAIRERAYHLWEASGYQNGNADVHWLAAQREILAVSLGTVARVATSDQSKTSRVSMKAEPTAKSKKKRRAA